MSLRTLNEEEYEYYLNQVFGNHDPWHDEIEDPIDTALTVQLRDEEGHRVEGCYRVAKAPTS